MKKEVWSRIIVTLIVTFIALLVILSIPSTNMGDYLLALGTGYIISKSIMPQERPVLMINKVAVFVFILAPIIIIYVTMPMEAILFYLLGALINFFFIKKSVANE